MRVRLCQYSLELLLRFLHDQDLMTILSLINNHVDLQVCPAPSARTPIH